MDSPFLRPTDPYLAEVLTDAFVHLLEAHGIDRFSVSSMARWMRVTPSAVLNDFSRTRVLENIVTSFGRRWVEWSVSMATENSLPVRLPESPDERTGVRAWSALQLLAEAEELRGHPGARHRIDLVRSDELDWITARLRGMAPGCCPPARGQLPAFMAGLEGARLALSATTPSITFAQAADAVDRQVRDLTTHRRTCQQVAMAS